MELDLRCAQIGLMPRAFADADERSLRVRARGVPVPSPRGLVKAATLHGLRVAPVPGGYEGEVILDV